MVMRIEDAPESCRNCGRTDLRWQVYNVNRSGVVDGRLRSNDISVQFCLGCEGCSETLMTLSANEFMREANTNREASYTDVVHAIECMGITMIPGLLSCVARAIVRVGCFKSNEGACKYLASALERAEKAAAKTGELSDG